jgi:hypothetical protein
VRAASYTLVYSRAPEPRRIGDRQQPRAAPYLQE